MGDIIYGRPSATYLVTFFVSDFLRVPLYSAAHTVCLGEKYFKMKTFLDLYEHLFVYVYTLTMHLSFISRIVEQFIIFKLCPPSWFPSFYLFTLYPLSPPWLKQWSEWGHAITVTRLPTPSFVFRASFSLFIKIQIHICRYRKRYKYKHK